MDLRQLKDHAQDLFDRRSYGKAAEAYAKACAAAPQDLALRQRWATALHRAGSDEQAIGLLREIAAAYANDGELLRAIAVNKLLLEIEPSHTETQRQLAQLYARRVPSKAGAIASPPPPAKRAKRRSGPNPIQKASSLLTHATTDDDRPEPRHPNKSAPISEFSEDAPTDPGYVLPDQEAFDDSTQDIVLGGLPQPSWGADQADRMKMDSPLFENLDPETFIELLQKCKRRTFRSGDVLIRQNAAAQSFFVLINGSLKVVQGPLREPDALIELARLSAGDFFGEMALLSRSPRMASVVSLSDGDALEFPGAILEKLVSRSAAAKAAVEDFMRARLLQNAMASSAIFRPFDRSERRHLFARFAITEVPRGTSLLTQGKPADGFYVIMEGSFRVDRDGEMLSSFSVGDTFGEISLLTHAPATASVIAEVPGRVLRLSGAAFQSLVAKHPGVQRYAKEIEAPRSRSARRVSIDKIKSDTAGVILV